MPNAVPVVPTCALTPPDLPTVPMTSETRTSLLAVAAPVARGVPETDPTESEIPRADP